MQVRYVLIPFHFSIKSYTEVFDVAGIFNNLTIASNIWQATFGMENY